MWLDYTHSGAQLDIVKCGHGNKDCGCLSVSLRSHCVGERFEKKVLINSGGDSSQGNERTPTTERERRLMAMKTEEIAGNCDKDCKSSGLFSTEG